MGAREGHIAESQGKALLDFLGHLTAKLSGMLEATHCGGLVMRKLIAAVCVAAFLAGSLAQNVTRDCYKEDSGGRPPPPHCNGTT